MKFRVISGTHCQGERDKAGKLVVYKRGEIFESQTDLVKRFNSTNSNKFERMPDETKVTFKNIATKPAPVVPPQEETVADEVQSDLQELVTQADDGYDHMSKDELIKWAEENEVDLGPNPNKLTKDTMIQKLRAANIA